MSVLCVWWGRLFLTGWLTTHGCFHACFFYFHSCGNNRFFSRTGRFRSLLGFLATVPGADLSGGGPVSRGIGFSFFVWLLECIHNLLLTILNSFFKIHLFI